MCSSPPFVTIQTIFGERYVIHFDLHDGPYQASADLLYRYHWSVLYNMTSVYKSDPAMIRRICGIKYRVETPSALLLLKFGIKDSLSVTQMLWPSVLRCQ